MKVLKNGKVFTNDGFKSAIAYDGKKIAAIGTDEEVLAVAGADAEVMDLAGKLVLPGFIDSHCHGPLTIAMVYNRVDLAVGEGTSDPEETRKEYLRRVSEFVDTHPDIEYIVGHGWINPAFDDGCPCKEDLDAICSDRPIVLLSGDGHSRWVNSKAIEMGGITDDTPDPVGGVIERYPDGSAKGCLRDQANNLVAHLIPAPGKDDFKEIILYYQSEMAKLGITGVYDALVPYESALLEAYREMGKDGELLFKTVLAYHSNPDIPFEESAKWPEKGEREITGKLVDKAWVKIFIDGVVEGGTAYLLDDYTHKPGFRSEPLWDSKTLNEYCAEMDNRGYELHAHCIGDAATKMFIDAVEYVVENNPPRKRNPIIAHLQLIDPADIDRMEKYGVSVSADPYWFFKAPGYFEDIEYRYLGERALHEYPMKSFIDRGITVSGASDYAVTLYPYAPAGIQAAVTRCGPDEDPLDMERVLWPEERITLQQGITVFTENGARTMGIEDLTGTLEVGKDADIVVMNDDLFEMDITKIGASTVFMTISEGDTIYTC